MYSIVDERKNRNNEIEYKIYDGNNYYIVPTDFIRENIRIFDGVVISKNGRIQWGMLSEDTEENKFYISLCNKYSSNGNDISIIFDLYTRLQTLSLIDNKSKLETAFYNDIIYLIKLFLHFMSDTSYTYMKVKFKKAFKSESTRSELNDMLISILSNSCNMNLYEYFCDIRFTFLGDCLFAIYLDRACSLMSSHTSNDFTGLALNSYDRVQLLDTYLTPYRKNYELFEYKLLKSRTYITRHLSDYEQDVADILSKISNQGNSSDYWGSLDLALERSAYLSELLTGKSEKDSTSRQKFIDETTTLTSSVALATGDISIRCGAAFLKFFTSKYDDYKRKKLPRNIYDFISKLDSSLTQSDISVLTFLIEHKRYKQTGSKRNLSSNSYNTPYLWIIFDIITYNRFNLLAQFNFGVTRSDIVRRGSFQDYIVVLSWISAYNFICNNLKNEVDSFSLQSSIFGKVNEDLYKIIVDNTKHMTKVRIEELQDMYDRLYSYCNKNYGYSFQHSNFMKIEDLEKLLI